MKKNIYQNIQIHYKPNFHKNKIKMNITIKKQKNLMNDVKDYKNHIINYVMIK